MSAYEKLVLKMAGWAMVILQKNIKKRWDIFTILKCRIQFDSYHVYKGDTRSESSKIKRCILHRFSG